MEERRKKLIKLIHIAKSNVMECCFCGRLSIHGACPVCLEYTVPLSDERYRQILKDVTGKESTRFMDEDELQKVYSVFTAAGFAPIDKKELDSVERAYQDGRRKTIGVALRLAKQTLGSDWENRLEGFVFSKTEKKKLYQLDDNQLRMVVGWLRRRKKYNTAENEAKKNIVK